MTDDRRFPGLANDIRDWFAIAEAETAEQGYTDDPDAVRGLLAPARGTESAVLMVCPDGHIHLAFGWDFDSPHPPVQVQLQPHQAEEWIEMLGSAIEGARKRQEAADE